MRSASSYPALTLVFALPALFTLALSRVAAQRQTPTRPAASPAPADPQAGVLINQMVSAYKALSTYAGTVEVQATEGPEAKSLRASVVIQRPDRAVISVTTDGQGLTRVFTDGQSLFVFGSGDAPPQPTPVAGMVAGQAIAAALERAGAADTLLAVLLTGQSPLAATDVKSLALGEAGTVGGVAVERIVVVRKRPQGDETLVFAVGQKDHLLRQVTTTGIVQGRPFTRIETHLRVRLNPLLPQAMFNYPAPLLPVPNAGKDMPLVATAAPVVSGFSAPSVTAAVPASPVSTLSATEAQRYDFGQVSLLDATQIEHTFPFKNTGNVPLKIARLSASCGCVSTFASLSAGSGTPAILPTLAPGEETSIWVSVNLLPLQSGALHKSVTVYAEGSDQPVARYEIAGTLLSTVTFSPPLVDFGRGEAGQMRAVLLTATVDPRLARAGTLPPLLASHPAVRVEPVADPRGTKPPGTSANALVRTYRLSLAPDAPLGAFSGSVGFAPPSAAVGKGVAAVLAKSSVSVTGHVDGLVSAQPQTVAFGVVPTGQAATRQVVLTGASAALKGRRVTGDSPYLSITQVKLSGREAQQPASEVLEVTLRAGAPAGVLQSLLTVTLANGQRLLLPVSAYVTGAAVTTAAPSVAIPAKP